MFWLLGKTIGGSGFKVGTCGHLPKPPKPYSQYAMIPLHPPILTTSTPFFCLATSYAENNEWKKVSFIGPQNNFPIIPPLIVCPRSVSEYVPCYITPRCILKENLNVYLQGLVCILLLVVSTFQNDGGHSHALESGEWMCVIARIPEKSLKQCSHIESTKRQARCQQAPHWYWCTYSVFTEEDTGNRSFAKVYPLSACHSCSAHRKYFLSSPRCINTARPFLTIYQRDEFEAEEFKPVPDSSWDQNTLSFPPLVFPLRHWCMQDMA